MLSMLKLLTCPANVIRLLVKCSRKYYNDKQETGESAK
jgi:hypothetical protein